MDKIIRLNYADIPNVLKCVEKVGDIYKIDDVVLVNCDNTFDNTITDTVKKYEKLARDLWESDKHPTNKRMCGILILKGFIREALEYINK